MLSLLMIIVLPIALLLYLVKFTRISYFRCIRASLIMFLVCIVCSLPLGEWETFSVTVDKYNPLETTKYIYVVPCEHFESEESFEAHITPVYTSLGVSAFCEDLTEVAFCPVCHTRKAAIKEYFATR